MNVEVQLITKILETGDFSVVNDMQITTRFFSGRNKKGASISAFLPPVSVTWSRQHRTIFLTAPSGYRLSA